MASRKTRYTSEEGTQIIIQVLENSDEEFTSDSEFEESDEEDMNDQSLHFCDENEVLFVADSNSQPVGDVVDDVHADQKVQITNNNNNSGDT